MVTDAGRLKSGQEEGWRVMVEESSNKMSIQVEYGEERVIEVVVCSIDGEKVANSEREERRSGGGAC